MAVFSVLTKLLILHYLCFWFVKIIRVLWPESIWSSCLTAKYEWFLLMSRNIFCIYFFWGGRGKEMIMNIFVVNFLQGMDNELSFHFSMATKPIFLFSAPALIVGTVGFDLTFWNTLISIVTVQIKSLENFICLFVSWKLKLLQ